MTSRFLKESNNYIPLKISWGQEILGTYTVSWDKRLTQSFSNLKANKTINTLAAKIIKFS